MNDYYNEKIKWLELNYSEFSPTEYYRMMFPNGSFQKPKESNGDFKPNGILQFRCKGEEKGKMHSRIINDDHKTIDDCLKGNDEYRNIDFAIISGCAYIGRRRISKNVRMCYAIIIDVDSVNKNNLISLLGMCTNDIVPMPTAIVVSGNGVHVVYMLDEPIPTYPETLDALSDLKAILSRKLWNEKTSTDSKIQYQGITQGYRMVGTKTKRGHITRAFKVGNKVSIDELLTVLKNISEYPLGKSERKSKLFTKRFLKCLKNRNLYEDMTKTFCDDITHVSIEEAKIKWPDWYERRIVNKEAPGHYTCGKGLYTWWLETISSKKNVHVGNRRNCMYCLAAFAQKCDVPEEELTKDLESLFKFYQSLSTCKEDEFTVEDMKSAVTSFRQSDLTRMTKKRIHILTGIDFSSKEKTKPRKKRSEHLKDCRAKRDSNYTNGTHWYDRGGRPSKEAVIGDYLCNHPDVKKVAQIAKECNVSRQTVYNYINKRKTPIHQTDNYCKESDPSVDTFERSVE